MKIRRKIENTLTKSELLSARDRNILKDFDKLSKGGYDTTYIICDVLQHKYYIQPTTIVLIINGSYNRLCMYNKDNSKKTPKQGELF